MCGKSAKDLGALTALTSDNQSILSQSKPENPLQNSLKTQHPKDMWLFNVQD